MCSVKNIKAIEQAYDGLCERCTIVITAYNRYADSNIPVGYWDLDMKDFKGPADLKNIYTDITENLSRVYKDGVSICLAGGNGIGKTMTTSCILKRVCQKNYSCLYTTLNDMVSVLIDSSFDDKFDARRELMMVDFLAIDEFDPRWISDSGADLFGRMLEHIFRTRSQNKLPTIMCSNSPNPIESFSGSIKQSIDSLMSRVKMIPILGEDYRKQQAK